MEQCRIFSSAPFSFARRVAWSLTQRREEEEEEENGTGRRGREGEGRGSQFQLIRNLRSDVLEADRGASDSLKAHPV